MDVEGVEVPEGFLGGGVWRLDSCDAVNCATPAKNLQMLGYREEFSAGRSTQYPSFPFSPKSWLSNELLY